MEPLFFMAKNLVFRQCILRNKILRLPQTHMNVHILQHVSFEGIGSMESWFSAHHAELSFTRFFENSVLPSAADLDLVVAMGGPMSVNDESEFPWLRSEKQFIREAIGQGVAVLGVCLGAQLIASSLGVKVYKNRHKEIGWFSVEGISNSTNEFGFPHSTTVFHWHGETFDLPAGAVRLAKSTACENQAFQVGNNVIGLQFHLETTPESARALLEHCSDELIPAPYIQTVEQIRSVQQKTYEEINRLMERVLAYITHPEK